MHLHVKTVKLIIFRNFYVFWRHIHNFVICLKRKKRCNFTRTLQNPKRDIVVVDGGNANKVYSAQTENNSKIGMNVQQMRDVVSVRNKET